MFQRQPGGSKGLGGFGLRRLWPLLHPFISPEEGAMSMCLQGPVLGVHPGGPGEASRQRCRPACPEAMAPCSVTAAPAHRPRSPKGPGAPPRTTCW